MSKKPYQILSSMFARHCAEAQALGFSDSDIIKALRISVLGMKQLAKRSSQTWGFPDSAPDDSLSGGKNPGATIKTYKGGIADLDKMLKDIERDVAGSSPGDTCDCPPCVARRAREAHGASHQGEPREDV